MLLSWSSGKDSAWSLYQLRQRDDIEVVGLFTTLNERFDRVAMHAVRRQLLELQAAAADLPLQCIDIPWPCSNSDYARIMAGFIDTVVASGVRHIGFGDLYLEDIRRYREQQLQAAGISALFPLWGLPTRQLAADMLDAGTEAWLTCVDPRHLDAGFAGRRYDHRLLADLPESVDPCGENGEFHSFVTRSPAFRHPVAVKPGEVVERDGFVYADLLPAQVTCQDAAI